ncbi:MAG TPA: SMP-30/gluconolactonase/LRE family protein [Anaerolineales bacterium]|nr:SMP-30/gluconolactonase/LRE family protein [Anaerolineales bacterium]
MKCKGLFYGLIALSLLFSAAPAMAQGSQPPVPLTPEPVTGPRSTSSLGPDGVPLLGQPLASPAYAAAELNRESVSPGASGTALRYLSRFGVTDEAFLADAQHIYHPLGLFIDGSDQLFVAEENGQRVLKFDLTDPTPTDPPTAVQTLGQAGQEWPDGNFLSTPWAMTEDGSGNIWVVANSFVKEFDPGGNLIQTIPATNPWEHGSDDYHFDRPYGIAFGPGGYLYVSDQNNQRVQIYDVSGTPTYIATIGVTGERRSDNSGFNQPFQIAFDTNGNLYVMDAANMRVQRCKDPGAPWTDWLCETYFGETGVEGTDLTHLKQWALGITIDASNNIFLADGMNYRVLKCNTAGVCALFVGATGVQGSDDTHFAFTGGLALDSDGNLYVSDSDNNRVQEFNSAGVYQDTFGVTGVTYLTDSTRLYAPSGVAVATDGSLYVKEFWGARLVKLSTAGVQQWVKGEPGVGGDDNNHFAVRNEANPAVDASGRVYVSDLGNNRVQIYNSSGGYVATLGTGWGQGDYEFACPAGIAISPVNGDIYVADQCNQRVQVFTAARAYKATLGQSGKWGIDNWSFNNPRGVAVDFAGNIYVADSDNDRVQKCTLSGGCTTFVGEEGTGYRGLNGPNVSDFSHLHPMSVAVDAVGHVYVADDWSNRIQVFDAFGAYLTSIGGNWGQRNGELVDPAGVAVDPHGNVFVADKENQRVEKYAAGYPNWTQANVNGFGNVGNIGVSTLKVFNGQLYAGTQNQDSGVEVWRSSDGTSWTPFSPPSTGADAVMSMEVFNNRLYIGTSNGAGGDIWSTDGASWSQVVSNGFQDGNNYIIDAMAVFSGNLYAATATHDGVMKVYRSSNGTDWNQVVSDGLGGSGIDEGITMYVHGGYLYLGLGRGADPNWVAELWRTDNGTTWDPIFQDGLGSSANTFVSAMSDFNGALYIGLRNVTTGGEVWKSTNGSTFTPVITGGNSNPNNQRPYDLRVLNSSLYLTFANSVEGAQVWRTSNGSTWSQISGDGWGDQANNWGSYFNKGAAVFNGSLYMGTYYNFHKGGQIWRYNNPPVTATLTSTGPQDGWILEKTKGSGTGGSMNSTATTFLLGDSAANQQYKAVLSFNTSTIPAGALIKSAVLRIKPSGAPAGTNPFTILGSLYADVRKGFFGAAPTLELGDFKAAPSVAKAGTFGKTPVSGWYTATLTAAGKNNLNLSSASGGVTQFRLYFGTATNSNSKADTMPFSSGEAAAAARSQLVITYTP